MVTVQDAVKNWKNFSGFVYDRVRGADKSHLTDEDYALLDKEGAAIMSTLSTDVICAKAKDIMNLNILDKNFSMDFFKNAPTIWKFYYKHCVDMVTVEFRA